MLSETSPANCQCWVCIHIKTTVGHINTTIRHPNGYDGVSIVVWRENMGSGRRQEERVILPRGLQGSFSHSHTQLFYFFLSGLLCLTHCGIPRILLSSFMRNNKLFLLAHMTNCVQTLLHTQLLKETYKQLNVVSPKID